MQGKPINEIDQTFQNQFQHEKQICPPPARFYHEYLVALRKRHNLHHKETKSRIQVGHVVIIKGTEKNRGKMEAWNCRKLTHWERLGGKRKWITYLQKPY